MSNYHPSNRLFHGECTTFQDAIATCIAQYEYEKALCPDNPDEAQFISMLDEGLDVFRRLQQEYLDAMRATEKQLIEKWRNEDGLAYEVADALACGEYSHLAI